ncbi:hypothetical protein Tco_0175678, partial [Tanacetum coccineum]
MLESKAHQTYLHYATRKVIPKEARKRTKAHISSLTFDEGIISKNLDDAKKVEAVKLVRKTHKRKVTEESSKMSTARRRQTSVTIRDTPTVTKKKTPEQSLKLKGIKLLFDAAMFEADTRK